MKSAASLLALSLFAAVPSWAKDGHATGAVAGPTTVGTFQRQTYYSYSYKAPGSAPKTPTSLHASSYARKGAGFVDTYKGSVNTGKTTGNWSATDSVNRAGGKVNAKITELKK